MTHILDVYLETIADPVGRLASNDYGALEFAYSAAGMAKGAQISLSLPLGEQVWGDAQSRGFFSNLLQENTSLQAVMDRHRVARDDIAGLLYYLGRDCPGAISCVPQGEKPGKSPGRLDADYDLLSDDDLYAIMESLRNHRRLPDDARDPSPLAGVQGKLAVAVLANGAIALPKSTSGAPTTHILKVPRCGEESLVPHEHALLKLAKIVLNIPVADAEILTQRDCCGLLIKRYDRKIENGLVTRLHQEDFCQAISLPPGLKYERDGGPDNRFDAGKIGGILDQTAAPAVARRAFRNLTLFNLAVGNTDNHAKNHALLYRDVGAAPVLAPVYDVVPVLLDPTVHHGFSFRLGQADTYGNLTQDDLVAFCDAIGIPGPARAANARKVLFRDVARLYQAIADHIDGQEGPSLKSLRDMISQTVGELSRVFGCDIRLVQRDASIIQGGGWGFES